MAPRSLQHRLGAEPGQPGSGDSGAGMGGPTQGQFSCLVKCGVHRDVGCVLLTAPSSLQLPPRSVVELGSPGFSCCVPAPFLTLPCLPVTGVGRVSLAVRLGTAGMGWGCSLSPQSPLPDGSLGGAMLLGLSSWCQALPPAPADTVSLTGWRDGAQCHAPLQEEVRHHAAVQAHLSWGLSRPPHRTRNAALSAHTGPRDCVRTGRWLQPQTWQGHRPRR